jgi:hypothetical protein
MPSERASLNLHNISAISKDTNLRTSKGAANTLTKKIPLADNNNHIVITSIVF